MQHTCSLGKLDGGKALLLGSGSQARQQLTSPGDI
jgi:hypothetical protein